MAKTLLDAVNAIFKRVGLTAGDAGLLTSLTDSARQSYVDQAVQVINEGITGLYASSDVELPNGQAESTVTLATNTRAYSLATDLVQMRWPLIDKTNSQYISEYKQGYNALLRLDPEQDDTGLPHWAAIRPTDGKLHMDRAPTSADNGKIYTYQYDKSLLLALSTDTVPFKDDVFEMMVPPWTQLWKREARNDFDQGIYDASLGVAARLLTQKQPRTHYCPR